MIVADADVISYFWLDVNRTDAAREVRRRDEEWVAPAFWKSEFRNVLYQHMQHRALSLSDALRIANRAEADLEERTYDVSTEAVLRLVDATGHSAYDCEYVALARRLGVPLVTGDGQVVDRFPDTATLLEDVAE
jgi:Predicted nucleic acid-binding protein, contains PIN domain